MEKVALFVLSLVVVSAAPSQAPTGVTCTAHSDGKGSLDDYFTTLVTLPSSTS